MHLNSLEDVASIIAIVGTVGSFIFGSYVLFSKLTKLIDSIDGLTVSVRVLRDDFAAQKLNYTEKFTRDNERLNSHEDRIKTLEGKI